MTLRTAAAVQINVTTSVLRGSEENNYPALRLGIQPNGAALERGGGIKRILEAEQSTQMRSGNVMSV